MKFWQLLLAALSGATLFYALDPDDPVYYPEVIVPAARIIEREPPVEVRFRDRIVYRYVQPSQVATAPGGAIEQVSAFCAPTVLRQTVTDTVFKVDTLVLIRSVTHNPGWFLGKDDLLLTSVSSVGDLQARDYSVRPGFSAIAAGDSLLVRYPRMALPREGVEAAVLIGVGVGLAKLIGW